MGDSPGAAEPDRHAHANVAGICSNSIRIAMFQALTSVLREQKNAPPNIAPIF